MDDLTVKMVHEDDKKRVLFVRNQIQRSAALNYGFVDAPESEQPKPKDGQPAVIPVDSDQAEEMESAAPAVSNEPKRALKSDELNRAPRNQSKGAK